MATASAAQRKPGLHYAWIVVGIAFVALLISAGVRSSVTVLIVPWEEEFGWSRATISFAIAIQLMLCGLVGPFSAGFIDRFGLRRTMLGALATMAAGMALLPLVTRSWELLPILGIFIGLSTGALAMVMAAVIANRWFVERRGLVMGLLSGSSATGQLIFIPSLAQIVAHLGWRAAVLIAASLLAVAIPVVWKFMRDLPRDLWLKPYGAKADAPEPPRRRASIPSPPPSPRSACAPQHRDFWLLGGSFFVCGASTIGLIGTHFIPACLDHGIPETTAAGILGAMGIFNVIGTTSSGWLSDRIDPRVLLCWFYASRGVSLLFLPYAFDLSGWALAAFGLFYGLDWIATVPPTMKLTTAAFGPQQVGDRLWLDHRDAPGRLGLRRLWERLVAHALGRLHRRVLGLGRAVPLRGGPGHARRARQAHRAAPRDRRGLSLVRARSRRLGRRGAQRNLLEKARRGKPQRGDRGGEHKRDRERVGQRRHQQRLRLGGQGRDRRGAAAQHLGADAEMAGGERFARRRGRAPTTSSAAPNEPPSERKKPLEPVKAPRSRKSTAFCPATVSGDMHNPTAMPFIMK